MKFTLSLIIQTNYNIIKLIYYLKSYFLFYLLYINFQKITTNFTNCYNFIYL